MVKLSEATKKVYLDDIYKGLKQREKTIEFVGMALYMTLTGKQTNNADWARFPIKKKKYYLELGAIAHDAVKGIYFSSKEERDEWLKEYPAYVL